MTGRLQSAQASGVYGPSHPRGRVTRVGLAPTGKGLPVRPRTTWPARLAAVPRRGDEVMPDSGKHESQDLGTTRSSTAATPWTATRATIRSTGGSPRRTAGPPAAVRAARRGGLRVPRRTARRGGARPPTIPTTDLGRERDRPDVAGARAGRRPRPAGRPAGGCGRGHRRRSATRSATRRPSSSPVTPGSTAARATAEEAAVHVIDDVETGRGRDETTTSSGVPSPGLVRAAEDDPLAVGGRRPHLTQVPDS